MIFNDDAERTVIGAMLVDPSAIPAVLDVLEPLGEAKFYSLSHGQVYAAVRGLWADGKAVDPLVVASVLGLEWTPKLAEFVATVTSTSNVGVHAGLVRDQWVRREVAAAANRVLAGVQENDPVGLARDALVGIEDLVVRERESAVSTIGDLVAGWVMDSQEDKQAVGWDPPLPCLPRLSPGRVYVIGGYTGQGKTALALQWASFVARSAKVTFHTLEMSAGDIRNRWMAQQGIALRDVESGRTEDWSRVLSVGAEAERIDLRVVDDPAVLAADVLRYQRALCSQVVFLDHVHQMEVAAKHGEHRLALNRELRLFVQMAKSEDVAVVLLAQLNRPMHTTGQLPRPTLRSLKESGAIEENAAYVGFVWRKADEDGVLMPYAEWIEAKNRFGPVRPPAVLEFQGKRMVFA